MIRVFCIIIVFMLTSSCLSFGESSVIRRARMVSNGDIFQSDFTALTGWAETGSGSADSAVENPFNGYPSVNQDTNASAVGNYYTRLTQDVGALPDTVVITEKINITKTSAYSPVDNPNTFIYSSAKSGLLYYFSTEGMYIADNTATSVEAGVATGCIEDDINLHCPGSLATGCDQIWTFKCDNMDYTGTGSPPVCDVWRKIPGYDATFKKVCSGIESYYNSGASLNDGDTVLTTQGYLTDDIEINRYYINIGSSFLQ